MKFYCLLCLFSNWLKFLLVEMIMLGILWLCRFYNVELMRLLVL